MQSVGEHEHFYFTQALVRICTANSQHISIRVCVRCVHKMLLWHGVHMPQHNRNTNVGFLPTHTSLCVYICIYEIYVYIEFFARVYTHLSFGCNWMESRHRPTQMTQKRLWGKNPMVVCGSFCTACAHVCSNQIKWTLCVGWFAHRKWNFSICCSQCGRIFECNSFEANL